MCTIYLWTAQLWCGTCSSGEEASKPSSKWAWPYSNSFMVRHHFNVANTSDNLITLPMEDIMLKMKKQVHALTPHDIVSAYQTIILSQDTMLALKQIEVHWIPKSDGTRSLTVFLRQISDAIAA